MAVMRACVLLLLAAAVQGLTVKVEATAEECFLENAKEGAIPFTFAFQVTSGGKLDIDVKLTDPRGTVIQAWPKATDGRHSWTSTMPGDYKMCFSNAMARWTPKWVSFYTTVGQSSNTAKLQDLDPIEKTIVHLTKGLNDLQEEQKQLRAVERLHRDTIEATNTRILYWSVFEALVLVVMGLFQ
eukprot:gene22554-34515_t